MEAKVPVIAIVRLVLAAIVRPVCDTPASGEPLRLLQQKGKVGPRLSLAAPDIEVAILVQAAPHGQIEVQTVQFPPRPEIGLSPARLGEAHVLLLLPEGEHLLHQAVELFRREFSLFVRDLPAEGVVMALHAAHELVRRILQALQVFFIDIQLFLR